MKWKFYNNTVALNAPRGRHISTCVIIHEEWDMFHLETKKKLSFSLIQKIKCIPKMRNDVHRNLYFVYILVGRNIQWLFRVRQYSVDDKWLDVLETHSTVKPK